MDIIIRLENIEAQIGMMLMINQKMQDKIFELEMQVAKGATNGRDKTHQQDS